MPFNKKILISSCLLGKKVRYDGLIKDYDILLLENYQLVDCCPEVDGGLPIPRPPSEIQVNGKVFDNNGIDVTDKFNCGANMALKLVVNENIKIAILKSKSPSCSNKMVYDGTFSGVLIRGIGVTTKVLEQNGIKVFDENEIEKALAYLSALK